MADARETIDATFDGTLTSDASEDHLLGTGPIPDGKTCRLLTFGASATGKGTEEGARVTLEQTNDGTTWKVLRSISASSGATDMRVDMDVPGDGAKQLRIVRKNGQGTPKEVTAWVTGYLF